jgi:Zn ribbon nucleic-acid-binding protein
MSNNIKNHLQSIDIAEGMQHRSNCPECGGRNTFTATKEDGVVVYNCYKLGCAVRGASASGMTAQEIINRLRPKDAEPSKEQELLVWPEYVVQPSAEHTLHKKFVHRWGLEHEDLMYDVKDRRTVFPIRHKGRLIDAAGRALDGATPKWYRYTGNADVYKRTVGKENGIVVVVEDVISAVTAAKLVPGLTGLAILGTSLSVTSMQHLDGYYKVIVALDPDAAHKTLQFKREIEAWTGLSTRALRLDDDIKYKLESDTNKLKEMICNWTGYKS